MVCLPTGKNRPLVHSSASAFSTAGVVGHGPSSNVSTTSLSVRKSNCLYCRKPKPGPPVVSITTMRLTPSASGWRRSIAPALPERRGTAGAGFESEAVISTSSLAGRRRRRRRRRRRGLAEPLLAPAAAKLAPKDDVEITAGLSKPAPQRRARPGKARATCANPDALGVSRVVEIDTTGGPGFGFEHFKQFDFLDRQGSRADLRRRPVAGQHARGAEGARGRMHQGACSSRSASTRPIIPKSSSRCCAAGHTVGTHTWSHANLNSKKMTEQHGQGRDREGLQRGEDGARRRRPRRSSAFPELQHNPAAMAYLGTRNVAMFSSDLDSFDFRANSPEQVINTVMTKLDKLGKGIILMHDFQKHTAEALPTLLRRLKAGGYKVVQMKAKTPLADAARI